MYSPRIRAIPNAICAALVAGALTFITTAPDSAMAAPVKESCQVRALSADCSPIRQ